MQFKNILALLIAGLTVATATNSSSSSSDAASSSSSDDAADTATTAAASANVTDAAATTTAAQVAAAATTTAAQVAAAATTAAVQQVAAATTAPAQISSNTSSTTAPPPVHIHKGEVATQMTLPATVTDGKQLLADDGFKTGFATAIALGYPGVTANMVLITKFNIAAATRRQLTTNSTAGVKKKVTAEFTIKTATATAPTPTAGAMQTAFRATGAVTFGGDTVAVDSTFTITAPATLTSSEVTPTQSGPWSMVYYGDSKDCSGTATMTATGTLGGDGVKLQMSSTGFRCFKVLYCVAGANPTATASASGTDAATTCAANTQYTPMDMPHIDGVCETTGASTSMLFTCGGSTTSTTSSGAVEKGVFAALVMSLLAFF